jgi:hypothetical protein
MDGTKLQLMKDIYMIICGFWGCKQKRYDSFDSFNTTAVVGIRFDPIYLLLMRGIEIEPRISLEEV